MLTYLRILGHRLLQLNWDAESAAMRAESDFFMVPETRGTGAVDPRELPRPRRKSSRNVDVIGAFREENVCIRSEEEQQQQRQDMDDNRCHCHNCRDLLDNLAECPVCLETLQGAGVFSCLTCGNVTCWMCCKKVDLCPFCRALLGDGTRHRNVAMERMLARMKLPCRNYRFGCERRLEFDDRLPHELNCGFAPSGCPLQKVCGWQGDNKDVARHLKDTHDMTLVAAPSIHIEISNFRGKMKRATLSPRKYAVSLVCHGHIFLTKVVLHQQKLKLLLGQVGENLDHRKFGAWLEVESVCKTMKGIVPVPNQSKLKNGLEIPCQALIPSSKGSDDLVRIAITIRPMQ